MKRIILGLLCLALVFAAGCLDYKAYDVNESATPVVPVVEETNESAIAPVEDNSPVEEDVVLPKLDEEPKQETEMRILTVKENQDLKLNVVVTDPDEDEVTYTFTTPFDQQGVWATQYGDAGEYIVTITATDGQLTTSEKVRVVVERVNVAPVIAGLQDITVAEGAQVSLDPQITDPNKDEVSVEISSPLQDGTFNTDHTSAGTYEIVVVASDGELETRETITLTVTDVNEKPVISNIPQTLNVREGEVVELKPEVTDLDEDNLEITISDPVGNDGVWETGFTDVGQYTITVRVDDGKDVVTQDVVVTIDDVNMPPEIVDVSVQTQ